ncbi:MBOAT family O-acyltransferase [Legionella waltersii]
MEKKAGIYYFGLIGNLTLLVYYKYSQFLLENINYLLNIPFNSKIIDLPLGISFFTFTQIAFLTDRYQKKINSPDLTKYGLFITFFPHLMAGPILHHKEIMPQFENKLRKLFSWENLAIGLSIFSIGLFKKTILADSLAPYANSIFGAASQGQITSIEAWLGSISYSFQLYFDFSGYSDMAIGLARMFGIIFPLNFNSPYKSRDIITFWRRWHITLSRFLKDYIYIPLGGNRKGSLIRYTNLLITMLIGGLWHGAAWTFIVWGALHGIYLVINHFWKYFKSGYFSSLINFNSAWYKILAQGVTFFAVMVGWVYFRADSISAGNSIIHSLIFGKLTIKPNIYSMHDIKVLVELIIATGAIIFIAPNTQQLLKKWTPAIETYPNEISDYKYQIFQWNPNISFAAICAMLTIISFLALGHVSEFLYYKF